MMNTKNCALVGHQKVYFPKRLVCVERRGDGQIREVIVDRLLAVVDLPDGLMVDEDVTVYVDVGFSPLLPAVTVNDQQAGESGVFQ